MWQQQTLRAVAVISGEAAVRELLEATQLRRLPGFGGKVAETMQQAGAQSVAGIQARQRRGFASYLVMLGSLALPRRTVTQQIVRCSICTRDACAVRERTVTSPRQHMTRQADACFTVQRLNEFAGHPLQHWSEAALRETLGFDAEVAAKLRRLCRGIDDSPVAERPPPKTLSVQVRPGADVPCKGSMHSAPAAGRLCTLCTPRMVALEHDTR